MPAASNVAPAETVHRSVRLRLLPESRQVAHKLAGTAGACRFVWNHFVARTQQEYSFREVRYVLKYLADAYQSFFQGTRAYPRFQSRHRRRDGFTIPEGVQVQHLRVPRLGWLRLKGSHPYAQGQVRQARIRQEGPRTRPRWYAYLTYVVPADSVRTGAAKGVLGLDRNVGQATASQGTVYPMTDVGQATASRRASNEVLCGRGGLGAS